MPLRVTGRNGSKHPVDLPSVGAAVRNRGRACSVCAAAAAPALIQLRSSQPPVVSHCLPSPVQRCDDRGASK
ncbi:uncharacterized protein V6R79_006591 [Siganus canaliculatus]